MLSTLINYLTNSNIRKTPCVINYLYRQFNGNLTRLSHGESMLQRIIKKHIEQSPSPLFSRLVYSVLAIISIYDIIYLTISATIPFVANFLGIFIFTPLTFFLEKKGHFQASRLLFLFSCNFYIFVAIQAAGIGFRFDFYYIPALLLALMIDNYEDDRQNNLIAGMILPILAWYTTRIFGVFFTPPDWFTIESNKNILSAINFTGSIIITYVFIKILFKTISEQRNKMIISAKMSSLGEIAGSIAHEINNPLSVIIGRAEHTTMKLEQKNLDKSEIISDLKKISETGHKITKLIKSLNTYIRSTTNDPFVICDIKEVILESIEMFEFNLKHKSIDIHLHCADDLIVNAHPHALSHALVNIIKNAIDAIEDLPERWIEIKVSTLEDHVDIQITDSGIGIEKSILNKIMLPFFTTKPLGKGTGLGLSITKKIIEEHRGSLFYEKNSANTRFVIRLPLSTN